MCGINGVYRYGGKPIDRAEVERVRDYMATRGPDNAGYWASEVAPVAFGHRRLSIIDLSEAGNQPMHSPSGRYHITFNGEIYNYKALRAKLAEEGHTFRTSSDTEILLILFEKYGPKMLEMARGMFTLAIWDEEAKNMVLARDALGIKPMYYANDGSTFRFASQVKALLEGGGVDTSPDAAGHAGFFLWGHVPEPYTLYKGIRQLPPGSYIKVAASGASDPIPFYDPQEAFEGDGGVRNIEGLREALTDSVNHHFVADVPVSLFLSAGRDSATVLALASESQGEPVRSVTLGFREYAGTQDDECPLARELAERYGAIHTEHHISSDDFRGDVESLLHAMDQPSVDGANTFFVCKVAASLGVRVALSGLGADEIFGGYPSFRQVPKLARSLRMTAGVPAVGRGARRVVSSLKLGKSPKYAGLLEYGGTIEGAFLLRRALFMPWEITNVLDREFAEHGLKELATLDRMREMTRCLPTDHAKIVRLESHWYMLNRLIRDSDWASMAHSLELRVPFVDTELMRRVGPWIASNRPPTKGDMASSPKKALPTEVLTRPKTGFNIPVAQWVLKLEPNAPKDHSHRQWARYLYRSLSGGDLLVKG